MKPLIAFALIATLAACGADGPPEPPASKSGISLGVSGSVKMGVVSRKGNDGADG